MERVFVLVSGNVTNTSSSSLNQRNGLDAHVQYYYSLKRCSAVQIAVVVSSNLGIRLRLSLQVNIATFHELILWAMLTQFCISSRWTKQVKLSYILYMWCILILTVFLLDFQIKEDLLGVIEGLEPESIDTAGLMIEAMSSVTNNVEELSSKTQVCEMSRAYGRR